MTYVARVALVVLAWLVFEPATADLPRGYVAVARATRVPADILYALACAESGKQLPDGSTRPWPWVLNVDGESRFHATRAAAERDLARALRRTTNVDVGLGQINWRWHGHRFRDISSAVDPYTNLRTAARLLREQFERCRCNDWWIAVEHYHAPSEVEGALARRLRYRQRVERCWRAFAS